MGGSWPNTPEKPGPMGCSGCWVARSGTWNGSRDDLRAYILERLGDPLAVLVIDETSFRKRGKKSAGVKQQYCGTTGRVENCQVGVFLSYVSSKGHTLIDRELYVPKEWIDDPGRCREVGIAEETRFRTKCELAQHMVERLWNAQIPFAWVVADSRVWRQSGFTHLAPSASVFLRAGGGLR